MFLCVAYVGIHAWPHKVEPMCPGFRQALLAVAVCLEVRARLGTESAELGVAHL